MARKTPLQAGFASQPPILRQIAECTYTRISWLIAKRPTAPERTSCVHLSQNLPSASDAQDWRLGAVPSIGRSSGSAFAIVLSLARSCSLPVTLTFPRFGPSSTLCSHAILQKKQAGTLTPVVIGARTPQCF